MAQVPSDNRQSDPHRPLVSVLIPCFNARDYVISAIASALNQSYQPLEVLVVNDGSTDGSGEVLDDFVRENPSVHVIHQSNQGGNAARQELLRQAKGPWLQYLDADDYLLPDKIAQQIKVVLSEENASVDLVYSPVWLETESVGPDGELQTARQEMELGADPDVWARLIRWQMPQTGGSLWRKDAVADVGGWKIDQPCCQEHELYCRLLRADKRFVATRPPGESAWAVYRWWNTQSVCRRDPLRTVRQRALILDQIEDHLRDADTLTAARQQALAEARLEMARSAYESDRGLGRHLAGQAGSVRLPVRPAFPRLFRWAYRCVGFEGAQRLAQWARRFRGRPAN